ncbi:MAG: gamma-glutamyl-phosphate reductase, partial [Fibrobacteres bacterium]|nr:gamma-glutamyl-phosphate reductase [Fibrobacterota bacterium]
MNLKQYVKNIAVKARAASRSLYAVPSKKRNRTLITAANLLEKEQKILLAANSKDISAAVKNKLSSAMVDRLTLNEKRIKNIADALRAVAKQPDPVGLVDSSVKRPNG